MRAMQDMTPGVRTTAHALVESGPACAGRAEDDCAADAPAAEPPTIASAAPATRAVRATREQADRADNKLLPSGVGLAAFPGERVALAVVDQACQHGRALADTSCGQINQSMSAYEELSHGEA